MLFHFNLTNFENATLTYSKCYDTLFMNLDIYSNPLRGVNVNDLRKMETVLMSFRQKRTQISSFHILKNLVLLIILLIIVFIL